MTDTEDDTMLNHMKSMADSMLEPRIALMIRDEDIVGTLAHVGIDYICLLRVNIAHPDQVITIAADKIITWTMADGPQTNERMA